MDYKQKLEYQSNYWYNDGLKKAQIRDLSGAIVSLKSEESSRTCLLWTWRSSGGSCRVDHQ